MDRTAFGNFLADLRNEKGYTQEQLSVLLNVNYKTISKWECGNSLPDLETMVQISEIFEVSLYELSIYKRINNPLVSKKDIKKIINKDSLTKFIFLKLIAIFIIAALLIFITYSCIYTINNYNQMQVYELVSADDSLDIEGIFIQTHDRYYLSINYINFFGNNFDLLSNKTKQLNYSIYLNNKLIHKASKDFQFYKNIESALAIIKLHISNEKFTSEVKNFKISINYCNENGKDITKTFNLNLSNKESNNKLFY